MVVVMEGVAGVRRLGEAGGRLGRSGVVGERRVEV